MGPYLLGLGTPKLGFKTRLGLLDTPVSLSSKICADSIPNIHDFSATAIPIQDMDLKKKTNHHPTLVRNLNFQNNIQLSKTQIKIGKEKKKPGSP